MINEEDNQVQTLDMNLWQRLTGIITNPVATLQAVIEKPSIIRPATVICLINLVFFSITLPKLQKFTLIMLESTPQVNMENLGQIKGFVAIWTAVAGALSAILIPLIGWLVLALLFKFLNMFTGNETPFKNLYAVSVITYVPVVLGSALRSILAAVSPAESFAYVTTSAAVFLPQGEIGPLFTFLSHIDPFSIWSWVLLVIGGALAMKTSYKKTGIFVFIIWILWVAIGVSIAALSPQAMPKA